MFSIHCLAKHNKLKSSQNLQARKGQFSKYVRGGEEWEKGEQNKRSGVEVGVFEGGGHG